MCKLLSPHRLSNRQRPVRNAIVWCTCLLIICCSASAKDAAAIYDSRLSALGVPPTAEGVARFLDQLHPDAEQRAKVSQLIEQLGHERFAVREAASAALRRLPNPPTSLLRAAMQAGDPEVAWRAKVLLTASSAETRQNLYTVFRVIQQRKLTGISGSVLRAFPFCDDEYLRRAARDALAATAEKRDAPQLRRILATDHDAHVRRAAVRGLATALGDQRADDMMPLLKDDDVWIRMQAARALADVGDPRALSALVQLMESDNLDVRIESAGTLRALSGESYAFTPYAKPASRQQQMKQWKVWVESIGPTVRLHFPIGSRIRREIGHTLVSLYNVHKVVELDTEGNEIRHITGYRGPWGAEPLDNGNLLINWFSSHTVVEYDRLGKEVWKWSQVGVRYVWSAQRLDNGNTLIACQNVVLEVDPHGKTVWKTSLGTHHSHAVRLENGNTLISLHQNSGKVAEVNQAGETVWEIPSLNSPYRVQRLENGNTLVTEKGRGRVVEFDPSGKKVVWSRDGFHSPDSAQRLLSGNTLVSDGRAIYEVTPDGKIVWQKPYSKSIIRRY